MVKINKPINNGEYSVVFPFCLLVRHLYSTISLLRALVCSQTYSLVNSSSVRTKRKTAGDLMTLSVSGWDVD